MEMRSVAKLALAYTEALTYLLTLHNCPLQFASFVSRKLIGSSHSPSMAHSVEHNPQIHLQVPHQLHCVADDDDSGLKVCFISLETLG